MHLHLVSLFFCFKFSNKFKKVLFYKNDRLKIIDCFFRYTDIKTENKGDKKNSISEKIYKINSMD